MKSGLGRLILIQLLAVAVPSGAEPAAMHSGKAMQSSKGASKAVLPAAGTSAGTSLPPGLTAEPFRPGQTYGFPNVSGLTTNPQGAVNSSNFIPPAQTVPQNQPLQLTPNSQSPQSDPFSTNYAAPNPVTYSPSTFSSPTSILQAAPQGNYTPYVPNKFQDLANAPLSPSNNPNSLGHYNCNNRPTDRLTCMVCNIYYEANDQPDIGEVTVGRSVMTRAMSHDYPNTVCKNVYQIDRTKSGKLVAQYSWTLEHKNHTLPDINNPTLQKVIRAASEALREGPNGYTNYYAQALVNPTWAHSGTCQQTIHQLYGHTFCDIGGTMDRSPAQYLAAEGLTSSNQLTQTPALDNSNTGGVGNTR